MNKNDQVLLYYWMKHFYYITQLKRKYYIYALMFAKRKIKLYITEPETETYCLYLTLI